MRNRHLFLLDLLVIPICAVGAFVLRLDWLITHYRAAFLLFVGVALLVKPPVFFAFGMYRRLWRYASIADMLAVLLAVSASSLAVAVVLGALLFTQAFQTVPRSVVFIDWLLTMACVAGVRLTVRVMAERAATREAAPSAKRVLVAGAGKAGDLVVREMLRNPELGMIPVGFLDDDQQKVGKRIQGVPVLGPLSSVSTHADRLGAAEVVITLPRAGGQVVRRIMEECRTAEISARVLPGLYELLDGRVSVSRLRNVEISDLLRRVETDLSQRDMAYLANRTVLVTGSGGSIGGELCRQVALSGARRTLLLGHGENSVFDVLNRLSAVVDPARLVPIIADVRNPRRLRDVFAEYAPDVVFHAAAHKHVPLMEAYPGEAVANNVGGTMNVVDAALAHGVERLVMISTDKAAHPVSVMGATKRLAEVVVRDAARRSGRAFSAVRFGNVLGSRGSVVPTFKRQIEEGGPITITHPDMKRFFMTIPEAVHLVLAAGGLAHGGELFVLDMGEPVRIVDVAHDLIRLSGLSPEEIPIRFTGLRPGEKLVERLYEEGALVSPTGNPDISIVREPHQVGGDRFHALLEALLRTAETGDRYDIKVMLSDMIPSYAPEVHAAVARDEAP
jgi:FlaA1/EpsC-like NDP-sugar epimerase